MKYTVKEEYIDQWYGSATTEEIEEAQEKGFTAEDINRLANDWGTSVNDLMEQVEEA
jgi:2-iminoacetate synthase ThiH